MMLRDTVGLIPRNNWDYGVDALLVAASGIYRNASGAPSVANLFGQDPVWTNAGRTSLYAILGALHLPAGAQVGVPLFCCSVVFDAICQAGLTPRFIDSGVDDYNLSTEDLRKKRSGLAAVVPVHMFGKPADMDAIDAAAEGIPVIEDCAQSLLSTYKGKLTGLLSTVSFFSFRCGKYISAGEGSAIICRDGELHDEIERVVASFPPRSAPGMITDALTTFAKATLYNRPWYGLAGFPVGMRLDRRLNLTAKGGFETGQDGGHAARAHRRAHPGLPGEGGSSAGACTSAARHLDTGRVRASGREPRPRQELVPVPIEVRRHGAARSDGGSPARARHRHGQVPRRHHRCGPRAATAMAAIARTPSGCPGRRCSCPSTTPWIAATSSTSPPPSTKATVLSKDHEGVRAGSFRQ